MNKRPLILYAACVVGVLSCKKEPLKVAPSPGAKEKLVGTWHFEQYATDSNANGKMDQNEITGQDPNFQYNWVFNSDGKATIDKDATQWHLINNDHYLVTGSAPDTAVFGIDELTASRLVLRDTATGNSTFKTQWIICKKM